MPPLLDTPTSPPGNSRAATPPRLDAVPIERALALCAALLLGAGLIFWVAANWQEQTRQFKYHLLQSAVLAPAAVQQLAALLGQGQAALAPLQRLDDPQGQYVLSPVVAP